MATFILSAIQNKHTESKREAEEAMPATQTWIQKYFWRTNDTDLRHIISTNGTRSKWFCITKQLLDGSVLIVARLWLLRNIFLLIPVCNLNETCFAYRHESSLLANEIGIEKKKKRRQRWRKKCVCACVCRTSSSFIFINSTQVDRHTVPLWLTSENVFCGWGSGLLLAHSPIPHPRLCYFASLLFLLNGLMLLLLGWLSGCDAMPCHCYCCSSSIFTSSSLWPLALHRRHNKMNRIVINLILKKLSLKAFKCSPNENRVKYEAIPLLLHSETQLFFSFFLSASRCCCFCHFVFSLRTRVTHFPAMLSSSSSPPVDVLWHVVVSHTHFVETARIFWMHKLNCASATLHNTSRLCSGDVRK